MTKTMEKIINNILVWYLKKTNILSIEQSGFRRVKSTIDNLFIIKSEINKAFENKQLLGMISLDITKAYDFLWSHRILQMANTYIRFAIPPPKMKTFFFVKH